MGFLDTVRQAGELLGQEGRVSLCALGRDRYDREGMPWELLQTLSGA